MSGFEEVLLKLLSIAMGGESYTASPVSALLAADIDWSSVVDLSFDQGVAAIAVDGLQKVYEANPGLRLGIDEPEFRALKFEWFGEVFSREDESRHQAKAIQSLSKLWKDNGLDTFALKGIAFARYYPVPSHRYSCDFDCNVRYHGSNLPAWNPADTLVREKGIRVDDSGSKHSRYVYKKVSVENHRNVIGVNGSVKRKDFDSYMQSLLKPSESRLLPGIDVYSPCWLFNALFCVIHAKVHFLEEDGIALKHVLDWVRIRKAPEAREWRGRFDRDIDRFELRRFFDALDGVADYVMGEKSEMTEAERLMLEDILAPKDVRQFKSKFLARLNILRMIWVNRWKYGYYSETTASAVMFRYVYGHFFDRDVK